MLQEGDRLDDRSFDSEKGWRNETISVGKIPIVQDAVVVFDSVSMVDDLGIVMVIRELLEVVPQADSPSATRWALVDGGKVYPVGKALEHITEHSATVTVMAPINEYCAEQGYSLESEELSLRHLGIAETEEVLQNLELNIRESFASIKPIDVHEVSHNRKLGVDSSFISQIVQFYESSDFSEVDTWRALRHEFQSGIQGELFPVKGVLTVEEGTTRLPIHLSGSGHQARLQTIWQVVKKRGILAFEEPELHLHPLLAKRLFRFLHGSISDAQIILTTHSTVFLDQCKFEEIWHLKKIDGQTIPSRIKDIQGLRETAILLGVRPSDVLMSNNILFVEGPTDRIVLESWARLLGIPLEPPRVSVIEMGGVSKGRFHLGLWAEVTVAAGVPMFMILDGDDVAKKAAQKLKKKQKDKAKLIESERVYNLAKEDIEDYYPVALLLNALTQAHSFNDEELERMTNAVEVRMRVDEIQKTLWELKEVEEEHWKLLAAEYVAQHGTSEDIDEEIRTLLYRIDSIFKRE